MLTPNTYVCPLFFDPVEGAGDRLAVGAIVRDAHALQAQRIIRDDSLGALYGKKGKGLANLIDNGLRALALMVEQDQTLAQVPPGVMGLIPGETRHIYASSIPDAFRTCVLMYSSLGNLEQWSDEEQVDETAEETNKRFFTEVRDAVLTRSPELRPYFNKLIPLYSGGVPFRFGFSNPRTILNFGILSANRQPSGIKDAQAKLWQLKCSKDYTGVRHAALIFGVPNVEDPTVSPTQKDILRTNIHEIERQADRFEMQFVPVLTAAEGAAKVIQYAA